MHYKRKKTRRNVRCTLCTPHRWRGNGKDRFKAKERTRLKAAAREQNSHGLGVER